MVTNTCYQSALPVLPLSGPNATGVGASDFVGALVGSSSVILSGFKTEKIQTGLFLHPAIPFVSAHQFDESLNSISFRKKFWSRLIMLSGASIIFCSALATGILGSQYIHQFFEQKNAAASKIGPIWSIVDVVPAGIKITVNGGPPIFIAVGSKLPNGDSVVSVSHEQNMIYLSSSTVVLRGAVKPELPILKDAND